jgi:hypothetical protein
MRPQSVNSTGGGIRIGPEGQGRVSSLEGIAYFTERIAQVEREA